MATQGGRRDGAGRPTHRGVRKQSLTIRITPTLREFLDDQPESAADTVEDTVRRSKRFREWKKNA